jgi:hypothetical protein
MERMASLLMVIRKFGKMSCQICQVYSQGVKKPNKSATRLICSAGFSGQKAARKGDRIPAATGGKKPA